MSDIERSRDGAANLRVGTAEREDTARLLGNAMAEGRLTMMEYEQRLDAVWTSSTRGDLAQLTDDLPAEKPAALPVESKDSKDWREYLDEWRWWFGGAIIMTGIWGVSSISDGEFKDFWPGWPLGIWAIVLVAMIFMPDDKDEDDEDDDGTGKDVDRSRERGY